MEIKLSTAKTKTTTTYEKIINTENMLERLEEIETQKESKRSIACTFLS